MVAPLLIPYILPVQLSSFGTEMQPNEPDMNASSPKASSTKSGKKFCACSDVPVTVCPPLLEHKHQTLCTVQHGVCWKMKYFIFIIYFTTFLSVPFACFFGFGSLYNFVSDIIT